MRLWCAYIVVTRTNSPVSNSRFPDPNRTRNPDSFPRKALPMVCLGRHEKRLGVAPELHGLWPTFSEGIRRRTGISETTGGAMEGTPSVFFVNHNNFDSGFTSNMSGTASGYMNSIPSGVQATPFGNCTAKPPIFSCTCPVQILFISRAISIIAS